MVEKSRLRNIVGAAVGIALLVLYVMAWTTAPAWAAQAKGSAQCPLPQKAEAVKPSKSGTGVPQSQRPPIDLVRPARTEIATFAMGWFWGPDARFGIVKGVIRTQVGYTGGKAKDPTYTNLGDHSEAIRIEYDPTRISYEKLLEIFWENHSPGEPSLFRQYASFVFYHNEAQQRSAMASRERVASRIQGPIYTEIVPASVFYPAEAYHQKYGLRSEKELLKEFQAIYPADDSLAASTAAARVNGYVSGAGTLEGLEREIGSLGLSKAGRQKLREIVKSD